MQPKVSIIVLNWNNWKDTIECLESIFQIEYPSYNVILVDNGSDDDSVSRVVEYAQGDLELESDFFPFKKDNKPLDYVILEKDKYDAVDFDGKFQKNLYIIKNDKNYGFAEGNNVGIDFVQKYLKPDYIEILNNDIVVGKNYLDEMVKVISEDQKIAMVGPKIYFYDYYGRKDMQTALGGYINWWIYPGYNYLEEKIQTNQPVELDWITGASLMIRADIPGTFLDTDFFFGAEDIDLSLRMKDKGYRILLVPTAEIWHKISLSRYKKFNTNLKRLKNNLKSHFTLVKKHKRFYPLYYLLYSVEMLFIYSKKLITSR
ncbi:MAG: glycosyltransferase family 2 protein [Methanobacterium sp.]|nr:glycosyltransferase family 2 protein [Methanobacterium sp.]